MNILHVIPPVKFGGGESILHSLVSMRRQQGNEESICCLFQSIEFEQVLKESEIPWFRLSNIGLGSGPARIVYKLYACYLVLKLPVLLRAIKTIRPHVVHLHGFPSNFIGCLLKKWGRLSGHLMPQMVYTHHALSGKKGFVEKKIFDNIYKEIDYVTAVSQPSLDSLLKDHQFLRGKSCVIHNFASDAFYEVGLARGRLPPNRSEVITFINVARFTPLKNHMAIVNAIFQLTDAERERVRVVLVGDGETLSEVKAAVFEAKLENWFEFTGFVPNARISPLLADADVMVFPSKSEGFGIAIAEALAAGLPVVALASCEAVVQLAADAGFFVEDSKLVDGIRYMLSADLLSLSRMALRRARGFDPALIKQAYLDVYKHVINADVKESQRTWLI